MKFRLMFVAALALAPAAASAQTVDSLAVGRKATDWFYMAQTDSLWAYLRDTTSMASRAAFDSMVQGQLANFMERAGFEEELLKEEFVKRGGKTQYWRTSRYSLFPEPLMLRWVIVDGKIDGMGINPASQPPERDPD